MKELNVSIASTEKQLGFLYTAVQILVLPVVLKQGNILLGSPLSLTQLNFALFCINFICVTVIFHRFLLQGVKQLFQKPICVLGYAGLGYLIYWLGSFLVNTAILAAYPDFANVNDASIAEMSQENFLQMFVGTVLLVPVVEETLYRGLIFGTLYKRNKIGGYILSTLIFAALHVIGYIGLFEPVHLLLCFLQYIPAGLCLAWAYSMTDSIWTPILIHLTNNLISILATR